MEHIVIIGNGISGITAARHIRKNSDKQITVISAESDYFFSRTALMYVYMGHMKWDHLKPYEDWFWEKNRIALKNAIVSKVSPENNLLTFSDGETMSYDILIIASGSSYNKFGQVKICLAFKVWLPSKTWNCLKKIPKLAKKQ